MQKKNNAPEQPPPANPMNDEVITLHAVARPSSRHLGNAAEASFVAKASLLGFSVSVPWGQSERYDSVVDCTPGFVRVQVKSASHSSTGRYRMKTSGRDGRVYTAEEIDFFVGYVAGEDIWYLIPIEAVGQRKGIQFYPNTWDSRGLFEKYREAWCLLDCSRKVRGWKDIPVLCRSREVGVRCAVCPLHK